MNRDRYPQVRSFASIEELRLRLVELGIAEDLCLGDGSPAPFPDDGRGFREGLTGASSTDGPTATGPGSPRRPPPEAGPSGAPELDDSLQVPGSGLRIPNRFAILPMEGWDGTSDGRPTDLVRRRWQHFGSSGAGLIWGGEAVAVRPEGRANPNQLLIDERHADDLAELRQIVCGASPLTSSPAGRPVIGIQLTHSGRFARPDGVAAPRVAYRHATLDDRVGATEASVLTDAELDELVEAFARAAEIAEHAGFDFVDVKACHGYLSHELLSGVQRPGRYGGSFEGRTRFLSSVIGEVRSRTHLAVGVRISAYDFAPFRADDRGIGAPEPQRSFAFGATSDAVGVDLTETHRLCELLVSLGVSMVCVSAGSPYYNPHIQRPAYFPPSDGYLPPEDPLVGVARMVRAATELHRAHPELVVVASGLSYLQDWLGEIARRLLSSSAVDAVGIGRMVLSYPQFPSDVLAGRPLDHRRICRTFSDCTTAPRNGLVSGCYPLDPFYKTRPERLELGKAKQAARHRA